MLSFYSSLPFTAWEIFVTSYHDVMIVCFNLLVGKPLHMHIGTAMVHLWICQCPHQSPQILQRLQTSLSLFQSLFHACDIYIIVCAWGQHFSLHKRGDQSVCFSISAQSNYSCSVDQAHVQTFHQNKSWHHWSIVWWHPDDVRNFGWWHLHQY